MIRGTNKVLDVCKKHIAKNQNELSKNKLCSWTEVECLGSCVSAPMMQINQDYFEDLDENKKKQVQQLEVISQLSAEDAKNQLVKAEKTKMLRMYSSSHYENVINSISINYH